MRQVMRTASFALIALAALGCNASTDRTDSPVILTIEGSTTIVTPGFVSVSDSQNAGWATIGSMTLKTIVKEPNATTSQLETVEMDAYQVTYTRADRGTRVPAPLTEKLFGSISPNGTYTLNGFPFMRLSQLSATPLSDLATRGIDPETGSATILLNVNMQFFGHTVSGKNVASEVKTFTVEVTP